MRLFSDVSAHAISCNLLFMSLFFSGDFHIKICRHRQSSAAVTSELLIGRQTDHTVSQTALYRVVCLHLVAKPPHDNKPAGFYEHKHLFGANHWG